jgi:uncharacterized protein (TIGR00266 family)
VEENMKYEIRGDGFQVLHCELLPGERIFAEAGEMIYASENVILETRAKGGVGGMLKRALTGESLFLTEFRTEGGEGIVAFGKQLGKVVPIKLNEGEMITAKRDTYMVSTENVDVGVALVKKIGAGLFGGKGFILQTFTAKAPDQMVFLEASGQTITLDLAEGQMIKIDTGNIVAFESTVDYDIQRVGGVKVMFLGGEGLFLSILKGPGRVWIQSACLAEIIAKFSIGKK